MDKVNCFSGKEWEHRCHAVNDAVTDTIHWSKVITLLLYAHCQSTILTLSAVLFPAVILTGFFPFSSRCLLTGMTRLQAEKPNLILTDEGKKGEGEACRLNLIEIKGMSELQESRLRIEKRGSELLVS